MIVMIDYRNHPSLSVVVVGMIVIPFLLPCCYDNVTCQMTPLLSQYLSVVNAYTLSSLAHPSVVDRCLSIALIFVDLYPPVSCRIVWISCSCVSSFHSFVDSYRIIPVSFYDTMSVIYESYLLRSVSLCDDNHDCIVHLI